jgi:hypothetical protein
MLLPPPPFHEACLSLHSHFPGISLFLCLATLPLPVGRKSVRNSVLHPLHTSRQTCLCLYNGDTEPHVETDLLVSLQWEHRATRRDRPACASTMGTQSHTTRQTCLCLYNGDTEPHVETDLLVSLQWGHIATRRDRPACVSTVETHRDKRPDRPACVSTMGTHRDKRPDRPACVSTVGTHRATRHNKPIL